MKPTSLAWMAGVLDLKGRVLYKNNHQRRTRQLVLAVDSAEFGIIRRLSEMTGTSPEMKAPKSGREAIWMRRSCVEHCPEAHVHVDGPEMPPTARWSITGAGFVVVYQNLKAYLTIDRFAEDAQEAHRYVALDNHGSGAVVKSLRRLKALGWALPMAYDLALASKEQLALPPAPRRAA